MRYRLERYKGLASRHTCPACGRAKRFVRYIDEATGRHLADDVGRCDRETSCGYHLKPGEYFAANPGLNAWKQRTRTGIAWQGRRRENGSQAVYSQRIAAKKPDLIDKRYLIGSLRNYDRNGFVQFLLDLFSLDKEAVEEAIKEYKIGTGRNGEAIFWQIDQSQRIRTGKIIAYDPATGRRNTYVTPNWIHAALKRAGRLPESFELGQCFFGEHLLANSSKRPHGGQERFKAAVPVSPLERASRHCDDLENDADGTRPIAIVEAEKTAVIASICKDVFPDLIWLACGGLSNLKAASLARIAQGRKVILFPDANGFAKWQAIASEASRLGAHVQVSNLLERLATDEQKAAGLDLADYLIDEQRKRIDPANREAFHELIEERLAIMTIDGGLTEEVAEAEIVASGFYADAFRLCTARPASNENAALYEKRKDAKNPTNPNSVTVTELESKGLTGSAKSFRTSKWSQ